MNTIDREQGGTDISNAIFNLVSKIRARISFDQSGIVSHGLFEPQKSGTIRIGLDCLWLRSFVVERPEIPLTNILHLQRSNTRVVSYYKKSILPVNKRTKKVPARLSTVKIEPLAAIRVTIHPSCQRLVPPQAIP